MTKIARVQFKPPVLSLRNAVLFSDAYSQVVEDMLTRAPTVEQGKLFELQIAEFLSPQVSAADVQHFCTCSDDACARRCAAKRAAIITTAVRWFRYFERQESVRACLSDVDFHHKSLVDHALVTLLVEKGAERRLDSSEAAPDSPSASPSVPSSPFVDW